MKQGVDITVYNSSSHPFQESNWNGINIVHKNDPENKLGTFGQFIYDLNCILDTRKKKFDIILQLGYTSSSIWGFLLPRKSLTITNMDGLEWKRSKYNLAVRRFLKLAEYLAIVFSDVLVSDSIGIRSYLKNKYDRHSNYIPYGADTFNSPEIKILKDFNVKPDNFNILVARMEPENNIHIILEGAQYSEIPLLIIGSTENSYGKKLKLKWKQKTDYRFLGSIYDQKILDNLRYYSNLYFHGHSVGGTNPSLLEAMASKAFIVAHSNIFNKSILGNDALYFINAKDIHELFKSNEYQGKRLGAIKNNIEKIDKIYNWSKVNEKYKRLFEESLKYQH